MNVDTNLNTHISEFGWNTGSSTTEGSRTKGESAATATSSPYIIDDGHGEYPFQKGSHLDVTHQSQQSVASTHDRHHQQQHSQQGSGTIRGGSRRTPEELKSTDFSNTHAVGPSSQTDNSGDGQSSVHLPLTPVTSSHPKGPASILTDRSSGSSLQASSYSQQISPSSPAKRFFPFFSSDPTQNGIFEPSHKSNKSERYRTLGRGTHSKNMSPIDQNGGSFVSPAITPTSENSQPSDRLLYQLRNGSTPVSNPSVGTEGLATPPDSSTKSSATQRFLRRVASAPNTKGLFASGGLFSSAMNTSPNSFKHPDENGTVGSGYPLSSHLAMDGLSISEASSAHHSTSQVSVATLSISSQPYHDGKNLNSKLSPPKPDFARTGSSTSSIPTSPGVRDHRSQSLGPLSNPNTKISLGVPSANGGNRPSTTDGTGNLAFKRTYSSNSIKTKTVEVTPSSFQKIKLLGKGDVGKVYLVREKKTERLYAMKGELRAVT